MKNLFYTALILSGVLFLNACSKDDDGGGNSSPTISGLNCAGASFTATAVSGAPYSGTATVPYSGGNGIAYAVGTGIASTGVTGLTATLVAGTLTSSTGTLAYSITGTPASSGTATFPISFGGQSCSISLNVGAPSPIVGKWYYDGRTDSAFCCLPGARTGAAITAYSAADCTIIRTITPANTYFYDFKADRSFTELYIDDSSYSGTYTFGTSAALGADTLNAIYSGGGGTQFYRINSLSPTQLFMRERTYYYSTTRGILPNGDTLLYRYVWKFKK